MTKRNVTLLLLVALAALVLDQVSKYLIVRYLQHPGNSTQVLGRFVIFELIYNRAGVFGIQFGRSLTYLIFPILGILLVILFASSAQHPGFSVCYGLILGGAFGNLIDRLFRPQGVVDFISPQFIHFRIAGRTFGM
ncbi:MAG: signal peptidase II, partial [candidate division WOR-3 bacterium]